MFYRNTNVKQINLRIISLAAGLALVAAAVVVGSDLLKEGTGSSTSPVTPRIERVVPQFGTAADAVFASQSIRAPSQFGTAADAVYAAQSILPVTGSVEIDPAAYLGLGQPAAGQSFGTGADAVYASIGLAHSRQAAAPLANLGDYLGIGQPGEAGNAEPQFGTMADADFASR